MAVSLEPWPTTCSGQCPRHSTRLPVVPSPGGPVLLGHANCSRAISACYAGGGRGGCTPSVDVFSGVQTLTLEASSRLLVLAKQCDQHAATTAEEMLQLRPAQQCPSSRLWFRGQARIGLSPPLKSSQRPKSYLWSLPPVVGKLIVVQD
jgi:hypothetical protein